MTQTTRWWWVRHAPVNSGGVIYGQDDLPCDCSDVGKFRALSAMLPHTEVWLTSHLMRTHQTAAGILAHRDAEPVLIREPDLAEQHLGDWQGMTHEALRAQRGDDPHRFWMTPAHEAPPNGESFSSVVDRVRRVIGRRCREHAGEDIVAVTHGGTIRAAVGIALGIDPERSLAFSIENLSVTCLEHIPGAEAPVPDGRSADAPLGGQWRIAQVNAIPIAD